MTCKLPLLTWLAGVICVNRLWLPSRLLGNLERMSMMYNNIGFDYTFLGLYERSLEYLQRSL